MVVGGFLSVSSFSALGVLALLWLVVCLVLRLTWPRLCLVDLLWLAFLSLAVVCAFLGFVGGIFSCVTDIHLPAPL